MLRILNATRSRTVCRQLLNCQNLSYASRGNFKDGVRYGKYGPVGSDKKTQDERNHSAKQFLKYKREKMLTTLIYWSICPVIFGTILFVNWYRGGKVFKSDSVLS